MADLTTDIRYIKGVGEARAKAMTKLEIKTLRDLVTFFPRPPMRTGRPSSRFLWSSRTRPSASGRCRPQRPRLSHIRKGLDLVKVRVVDEGGAVDITFFNQAFVKDALKPGEVYVFYGKVTGSARRLEMANPVFEREEAHHVTGRIVPVYRLTAGLSQNVLAGAVRQGARRLRRRATGRLAGVRS